MVEDLHLSFALLNRTMSVNYVGLAMGCWLFIPVAKKFGRRPVYIASMALMTATIFWSAKIQTLSELYATNPLSGLAGATNEAIVQITVRLRCCLCEACSLQVTALMMVDIRSLLRASSWWNEWVVYDNGHDWGVSFIPFSNINYRWNYSNYIFRAFSPQWQQVIKPQ